MDDKEYQELQQKNRLYRDSISESVTVTPQEVANRIHGQMYTNGGPHSHVHSCPCYHLALFYLGRAEHLNLFWPDGDGGNAWEAKQGSKVGGK